MKVKNVFEDIFDPTIVKGGIKYEITINKNYYFYRLYGF